jgi:fimbrial isopeptide formation D2 family protein
MRFGRAALTIGAVFVTVYLVAPAAMAAPTVQATAPQVAAAIAAEPATVTGASYSTISSADAAAVWDSALTSFPTNGSTFGVLSSGNAGNVADAGTFTSVSNNGGNIRGNTDLDVTIMKTDLSVPTGRNCLSVDFQFLSEEFPDFVGSDFNDAFIAELDTSSWTTSGSTITAANNFAFDPAGNVISINSTGIAGMSAANGAGTAFDGGSTEGGATQLLRASTPITPGAHSVYFSIFDQGDQAYDSAVFLDNLFLGTAPEGECEPGAQLPPPTVSKTADAASSPVGGTNGYTITMTNPNDEAVPVDEISDTLPDGFSYVAGSTTGAITADPKVEGQTLTWDAVEGPLLSVPPSGTASLSFDVTVADTPGEYFNEASFQAGDDTGTTGSTAPITVEPPDPPGVTKAAHQASSLPGAANGYTITVSNPNLVEISIDAISDTLPGGFSYLNGSTSGDLTSNPQISGQTLSWQAIEGSLIDVPAEGSISFSFDVTVSGTPGQYFNEATAEFAEDSATSGPTAPITVAPPPILSPCDPVTIDGTGAGEKLVGTAGADRVRGLGGRDVIDGIDGDDQLCGGQGGDYLYGRAGAEVLRGEDGNDRLYGSRHADTVEGGAGHDALISGRGADTILAADGVRDCILTGKGEDSVAADPVDLVDPKRGCAPGF